MIPSATQIRRLNSYEAGTLPRRCSVEAFVLEIIATQRALAGLKRDGGVILRMIVEDFDQQEIAVRIRVAPRTVSNRLDKLLDQVDYNQTRPHGEKRIGKAGEMPAPVSTPRMHAPREESQGTVLRQRLLHEGLSPEKPAQVTGAMPTLRKISKKARASS